MYTKDLFLALIVLASWGVDSWAAPAPDPAQARLAIARARTSFASGSDAALNRDVQAVLANVVGISDPLATEAFSLLERACARNATGALNIPTPASDARFGEIHVHFSTYTRADYIDATGKHWAMAFEPEVWVEGPADLPMQDIRLSRQQPGKDDVVYVDSTLGTGMRFFYYDHGHVQFAPRPPSPTAQLASPQPASSETRPLGFARTDLGMGGAFGDQMSFDDPRWKEIRGLYTLAITLDDGGPAMVQKFVVSNPLTDTVPRIVSPADGAVVTTHKPQIELADFTSPDFKSFEQRQRYLMLIQDSDKANSAGDRPGEALVWSQDLGSTNPRTVPVTTSLLSGKFFKLVEHAEEIRQYGSVKLSRDYVLEVPFSVRVP